MSLISTLTLRHHLRPFSFTVDHRRRTFPPEWTEAISSDPADRGSLFQFKVSWASTLRQLRITEVESPSVVGGCERSRCLGSDHARLKLERSGEISSHQMGSIRRRSRLSQLLHLGGAPWTTCACSAKRCRASLIGRVRHSEWAPLRSHEYLRLLTASSRPTFTLDMTGQARGHGRRARPLKMLLGPPTRRLEGAMPYKNGSMGLPPIARAWAHLCGPRVAVPTTQTSVVKSRKIREISQEGGRARRDVLNVKRAEQADSDAREAIQCGSQRNR